MEVTTSSRPLSAQTADTLVLGLFDGEMPSGDAPAALGGLLDSGEARRSLRSLALAHADGRRWLLVGLGFAQRLHSRARAGGCGERPRALPRALGPRPLLVATVRGGPDDRRRACGGNGAGGLPLRTLQVRSEEDLDAPPKQLEALVVACPDEFAGAVSAAAVVVEAANRARDLQNRPGKRPHTDGTRRIRQGAGRGRPRPERGSRGPRRASWLGEWEPSQPSRRAPSRSRR